MNGFERIQAALKGEPADRVPVMLHNFMMAAEEIGATMGAFREDPAVMARAFVASVERYGFDGILVDMDTVTLAGALGAPVDLPEDAPARSHRGCLASLNDVRSLEPPNVENYRYVQVWLEAVRLIKEEVGDEIFVRGNCDQAPFSLASMVRGAEAWMMDLGLAEDDALLHDLLALCTEATIQFVDLMAQTGCDMVSNGDSPAGPSMISPRMYRAYALPYEQQVVRAAHAHGLPYALHICGKTDVILEPMLEAGADAYELDYQTDARRVYDLYHNRATLIGTIDPSGVLARGTTDDVRRATSDLLDIYGHCPRFILNAGCALPPTTPPANIHTLIETARTYR